MSNALAVLHSALEEADRRDVQRCSRNVVADGSYDNPATGPTDRAGIGAFHAALFKAFPDVRYAIERALGDDRLAVAECTVSGTHQDTFAGIPATGRTIHTSVAFSIEVSEGKETAWRSHFDPAAMIRQLTA